MNDQIHSSPTLAVQGNYNSPTWDELCPRHIVRTCPSFSDVPLVRFAGSTLISAAAIIRGVQRVAIKLGLLKPVIDHVVDVAEPTRVVRLSQAGGVARAYHNEAVFLEEVWD